MGRQYKQLGGKIWILLEARIFNTDGSKSEKVTRVLKLGWNLTVPVYIQQLVPPSPGQFWKYFSSKSPKLNFYP